MKQQLVSYYNNKTTTSLVINIKAYEKDYQVVYPSSDVNNKYFDIEEAKKRLPFIVGLTSHQRVKIINHIVASLYDYIRFLNT